jgi:hypothetical protein
LNHSRFATISHISCLFSSRSHHCAASCTAISSASAAFGCASTQSARSAKLFSGWSFQSSPVVSAV